MLGRIFIVCIELSTHSGPWGIPVRIFHFLLTFTLTRYGHKPIFGARKMVIREQLVTRRPLSQFL